MNTSVSPAALTPEFAGLFGRTKHAVVATADVSLIEQFGAAYLDDAPTPVLWPELETIEGQVIETFVCDDAGGVSPTSNNQPYVEAWQPLVESAVTAIERRVAELSIELVDNRYVTVSATPVAELEGTPHLDDDLLEPDRGVSLVAIMGQWVGPRVATEGYAVASALGPYGQILVPPSIIERFDQADLAQCQGDPDRLVLFPQFGQLHAGPSAADVQAVAPDALVRQLLVYRATTRPTQNL